MRAEQATEPIATHGEGPHWDERGNRLLLVDMLEGDVLAMGEAGEITRHHVGPVAATIRSREAGGFVLALERGFALADEELEVTEVLDPVVPDAGVRMNDGGCDPRGRFYCGTMAYDMAPGRGALYRLDADRTVTTVLTGVTISNGIQWSADGARAFYADTPTGRVDAFDVDPGSGDLSGRRAFARIDPSDGAPDGMAIDSEDGIWVALWGGSQVRRYDAEGTLDLVIELPVRQVTACAFGGTDRRTLFITTSSLGLVPGDQPEAGAVFRFDSPVAGAVPHRYAG